MFLRGNTKMSANQSNLRSQESLGRRCMSLKSSSLDILRQIEKIYWALEAKITPLIVDVLKEEANKPLTDKQWISNLFIVTGNGKNLPISKIVKELVEFRSKLTALRVGYEFIPNMNVEIDWIEDSLAEIKLTDEFAQDPTLKEMRETYHNKTIIKG